MVNEVVSNSTEEGIIEILLTVGGVVWAIVCDTCSHVQSLLAGIGVRGVGISIVVDIHIGELLSLEGGSDLRHVVA